MTSSSKSIKQKNAMIDYSLFNYCVHCRLRFPKNIRYCDDCHQRIRTKPASYGKHRFNRTDKI